MKIIDTPINPTFLYRKTKYKVKKAVKSTKYFTNLIKNSNVYLFCTENLFRYTCSKNNYSWLENLINIPNFKGFLLEQNEVLEVIDTLPQNPYIIFVVDLNLILSFDQYNNEYIYNLAQGIENEFSYSFLDLDQITLEEIAEQLYLSI